MTAVRPEGAWQSGADPDEWGVYEQTGQQWNSPEAPYQQGQYGPQHGRTTGPEYGQSPGQAYGGQQPGQGHGQYPPQYAQPYGQPYQQQYPQPTQAQATQPIPTQQRPTQAMPTQAMPTQPMPTQPMPAMPPDAPGQPGHEPTWVEQTLQLRVITSLDGEGGGRVERRRVAQGRVALRSGTGRRRAAGRPAGPRVRPKEAKRVVAARVTGELFITFGMVLLLFVAYQLWWTNLQADQAAGDARSKLEQQWNTPAKQPAPGAPAAATPSPGAFEPGQGFAIVYLPKLGKKFPIAEGTDKHAVLDKGLVGHYVGTAMPSDKAGNFALAAHRNTHGEPFRYINHMGPGDLVVVETATDYYTYQITSGIPQTSPQNVSVIEPVPKGSGYTQPGRYITLTTCTPEFTSKFRLILFGKMVDDRPRSQGQPSAIAGM